MVFFSVEDFYRPFLFKIYTMIHQHTRSLPGEVKIVEFNFH